MVLQLLSAFGAVRHLSGPTEVSLSDLCHVTYTGSDVTNLSDVINSDTEWVWLVAPSHVTRTGSDVTG